MDTCSIQELGVVGGVDAVGELKIATRMHGSQPLIANTFTGFVDDFLSSPTASEWTEKSE